MVSSHQQDEWERIKDEVRKCKMELEKREIDAGKNSKGQQGSSTKIGGMDVIGLCVGLVPELAAGIKSPRPPGWLGGDIVNEFMALLAKTKNKNSIRKEYIHMDSQVFHELGGARDMSERWLKKQLQNQNQNLDEVHAIIIPVNSGVHWSLLLANPPGRTIHQYDSMLLLDEPEIIEEKVELSTYVMRRLPKWLKSLGPDKWAFKHGHPYRQPDLDACGPLTCFHAALILYELEPPPGVYIHPSTIPYLRWWLAYVLYRNEISEEMVRFVAEEIKTNCLDTDGWRQWKREREESEREHDNET